MPKELRDYLNDSIAEKMKLANTISKQMGEDVKNKIISPQSVQQVLTAIDNLDAATVHLLRGEHENAIHFFSRACANLGEFKGRTDKERGKS